MSEIPIGVVVDVKVPGAIGFEKSRLHDHAVHAEQNMSVFEESYSNENTERKAAAQGYLGALHRFRDTRTTTNRRQLPSTTHVVQPDPGGAPARGCCSAAIT